MQSGEIRKWAIGVIITLGLLCLHSKWSLAAQVDMRFNIERNWKVDGTSDYTIRVFDTSFPIFIPSPPYFVSSIKLTAPDGSSNNSDRPYLVNVTGLSFTDLQSRFIGEWTIQELGTSGAISRFSLLPFTESSFFNEQPSIVSPLSGEVVPATFNVDWSFPSGTWPNGRTVSYSGLGQSEFEGNFSPTSRHPRYTATDTFVTHEGVLVSPPEQVTFRAGSYDSLGSYFSAVSPVSGVSPNTYTFQYSGYRNMSAPLTFTVIPEPNSVIIVGLGIGVTAVAFLQRRRRAS